MLILLSCALLLSACSGNPFRKTDTSGDAAAARVEAARRTQQARANEAAEAEKAAFHAGVSSVTVENLAKQRNCVGGLGASLEGATGPVELYRMVCDNGTVFRAKCELRQCKAM